MLYSHFSWLSMFIRTCLAGLDWNNNTDRAQKLSSTGKPLFRVKIDRYGNSSVVPVKVKKCYQWQKDIFQACLNGLKTGEVPQHQVCVQLVGFSILLLRRYFVVSH